MSDLFKGIKQGLEEAIEYEKTGKNGRRVVLESAESEDSEEESCLFRKSS